MSNNYGAFAAITVDTAGTEHAVWEHLGSLWYTYFDTKSNQWSNAEPISDAPGGSDLQLVNGVFIPYRDAQGELQYGPGLAAVWEGDGGDLYYVVGRYTETGQIQWSNTVEFGQPNLKSGQTILSQNPQAGIEPAGSNLPPALTAVYEIFDASTTASVQWTGDSGYKVNITLNGIDQNNDGLISGRGTNNALGDGITNELLDWTLTVLDPEGSTQATYTLDEQLLLNTFNFNFDTTTNQVLANADADVFSIQAGQFGLNLGLDDTVPLPNPSDVGLWNVNSQATEEKLVLQQIDSNTGTTTQEDSSTLSSKAVAPESLITDDTDLYFDSISFMQDGDNLKETGTDGNPVIFEDDIPLSPNYQSFGPEAQFLTQDVITNSNPDNAVGVGGSSNSSIATTPIGAAISFDIPLSGVQKLLGQSVPLPSSLIAVTNEIPNLTIEGSIAAERNSEDGENTYVLSTSLALKPAEDDDEEEVNNPNESFAKSAQSETNSSANELDKDTDRSVTLQFDSVFTPNEETGDLEYTSQEIKLIFEYGTAAGFTLEVPPAPSPFKGDLIKGGVNYSVLNFGADIGITLDAKEDANLLPIHLSGNENEGNIKIQNSTLLNILDGVAGGAAAIPQSMLQLVAQLAKAEAAAGNDEDGQATDVLDNIDYAVEFLIGLLYAEQIIQQAGYLFENLDQYTFDEETLGFEWAPSVSGTASALENLLKVDGGARLAAALEVALEDNNGRIREATTLDFEETASFSGQVLFWKWSWSTGWEQEVKINEGKNTAADLSSTAFSTTATNPLEEANTNGGVAVSYNPTSGTDTKYDTNSVIQSSQDGDTGDSSTLNDLTDDQDVALIFEPNSEEGLLVWVAAGAADSTVSLVDQKEVAARVLASTYIGAAWDSPLLVNQKSEENNSGALEGFTFSPTAEFFFTNAVTGEIVNPNNIVFSNNTDRSKYNINRMVVWAYADTSGQGLNENSTPAEVQAAVQDTDIYYSWSSRNLARNTRWGNWSDAQLIAEQSGSDSLPTLGLSADGKLRLAWVNTPQNTNDNIVYTTTVKPSINSKGNLIVDWNTIEQAGEQSDLQISKLLIDNFGDNQAIYWTDAIEPTYQASVLQHDPALYYRMDNSGSNNETNLGNLGSSSNGTYTDGTVTIVNNGALFNDVKQEGDPNASAQFTTDGGYLTIPVGQSTLSPSYSVELWAKLDSTNAGQVLLEKEPIAAVLDLSDNGPSNEKSVEIPSIDAINFGTNQDFTVEAWISVQKNGQNDASIIEKSDSSTSGYPFVIRYQNGKIVAMRYDGETSNNNPKLVSQTTFNPNEFHHVAFVKSGKTLSLYVDGKLEDSTTDTTQNSTTNTSPLFLGRRGDSSNPSYFAGQVDDVRLWNVARTEEQIEANRIALQNTEEAQTNLVGRYTFSDNTANDSSTTGNNGAFEGKANVFFDTENTLDISIEADWALKTGNKNNLVFDVGTVEVSTGDINADEWYYVVATVDTTINGSVTNPVTTLYLNGEQVDQQQGPANLITDSVIIAGKEFKGQLDEIALYNRVLGKEVTPQTDSNGNVTNYTTSPTSAGAIDAHYAARFNPTENIVGDGTYYTVLEDNQWGEARLFQPQQKLFPSTPLLERAPTFDVVSTTALEPDTVADLYIPISIYRRSPTPSNPDPSQIIQAIQVTSPDNSTTWSTNWQADADADKDLPLAIVQDGILVNDAKGFEKTLLSSFETFDLYFQGTAEENKNYTVTLTYSDKTTASKKIMLQLNPSVSSTIGDIISAQGDILENEVSSLAKIDSGLTLGTSEDYVGTAMAAGNFLNGAAAIAVAAPYASNGDGAVLILPAGNKLGDNEINNNPLDPTKVPNGGVLIKGSEQEQLGFALAVGDINNDKVDDLVIGAPRAGTNNDTGLVYVVSGTEMKPGTTIDLSQTPKISGFDSNSEAGYALATGDVNNDGIDDIVIGAPLANKGAGKVYRVKGSNSFSNVTDPTVVFTGEANSQAGFSVDIVSKNSSNKTLNNDAFSDVVIGAPNYSQTVTFNNSFENETAPSDAIEALAAVSPVISDNKNNTGSNALELNTGRAYVLLGNDSGVTSNPTEVVLDGSPIYNSNVEAGYSVSGAGDINSDGFEDLVIGAPAEGKGSGITYVVAGRESFNDTLQLAWESNLLITGPEPHARSGNIVSDAGDFNQDGASDLVIGSPNAGFSAGQAHVLFGNTKGSKNPLWSENYSTAFSLAPGITQSTAFFNQSGGTTPAPSISTFVLNGTNPQDAMIPTRSAVDVNGDGVNDLLASAQIGNQVGILFGHPWLADEGSLKIKDLKSDQGFIVDEQPSGTGNVVQLLGDLNQDGYAETLVAGNGEQSTIVFGASTQELLDGGLATLELTLTHDNLPKFAAVGDVNGDGFQDLAAVITDETEALQLNGTSNYAEIPSVDAINFDTNQDFTVEAWIQVGPNNPPNPNEPDNDIIEKWSGSGSYPFVIRFDNESGKVYAARFDASNNPGSNPQVTSSTLLDDDQFHHVAFVKNGKTLELYVDGVLEDTTSDTTELSTTNDSALNLGRRGTGTNFFNGQIDDIRLWNVARSQAEIQANLNVDISSPATEPNLVGYYTFDDGNVTDGSKEKNNGSLQGGAVTAKIPALSILLGSAELATQGTQALSVFPLAQPVDGILPAQDINGDGLNDWIINSGNVSNLYLAQANGTLAEPVQLSVLVETAVVDVNQDGFSDLVSMNSSNPVITFGGSDFSTNRSSVTLSALPVSSSEYQIANAGDVNGDGRGDFAVSLANKGTVILAVSQGTGPIPSYKYLQFIDGSTDTLTVNTGGDINGDGLDDLVIGQPNASTSTNNGGGGINSGEVFLVFGNGQFQKITNDNPISLKSLQPSASNSVTVDEFTVLGLNISGLANSKAGTSIAGGQDVNGDGLDDFAVGAPDVDNLSYVLFGGDFTSALTQGGTIANDVLRGTATGDAMIGNSGIDFLLGNGGIDALSGGAGNDVFTIADTNFRRIDGGSGFDVLKLEGKLERNTATNWNLVDLTLGGRLQNLEVIDITGYGNNELILDSTTALNLSSTSNIVFIDADNNAESEIDTLVLSNDFTNQGLVSTNSVAYEKYTAGEATVFVTPGTDVSLRSFNTVTVTTAEDMVNGDVSSVIALQLNPGKDGISLREAVLATNNTLGADTINFASNLANSTISLSEGQLNITDDLTITGSSKSLTTISGNNKSRVININDNNNQITKTVKLDYLKIIEGRTNSQGGGIFNREKLTVSNSVISGNSSPKTTGGGIYNGKILFVENSTVSNNTALYEGGGIATYAGQGVQGNTTIISSTISHNTSLSGGGLSVTFGKLEVVNSTISGNTAESIGGGIFLFSESAGVIRNSTISGNEAVLSGAGLALLGLATAELSSTTIYNNKHKIKSDTAASLYLSFGTVASIDNTIISGTTKGNDVYISNTAAFSATGVNIVSNGNFANNNVLTGNPQLAPLADNGGSTQTHLPMTINGVSSIAIDAADSGPAFDQRGVRRPQGSKFDIGAVEVQATRLTSLDDTVDTFDTTPRIFISETVVSEADGEAKFTIVRTGDTTQGLTLNYTTQDGTADAGVYFTPREGKIIFAPGETTTTVTVPITEDDILREAIRNFELRITEDFEIGSSLNLTLLGGEGDDVVQGNDQPNFIFGEGGDDTLFGEAGDDTLRGGQGDDQLFGGADNDLLIGGSGTNTLTGGLGNDTFEMIEGETAIITDFGGMGRGSKPSAETRASLDTLRFTTEGLTAETLQLNQVDDDLELTFLGDETDTTVILQNFDLENIDNLLKKTGANVDFDNIEFVDDALNDSIDVFNANSRRNRIWNRNSVTFLNDLNNRVRGFSHSDDVINGQGGNDTLRGLSGDDILRGGDGDDRLQGGRDDDLLRGGVGDDTVIGGHGRDTFVLAVGDGTDTIQDFKKRTDLIGLANGLSFGQLTFRGRQIRFEDQVLAVLIGVRTEQLGEESFLEV